MGALSKWNDLTVEIVTLLAGLAPVVGLVLGLALADRLLPLGARLVAKARGMFGGSASRGGGGAAPRTARTRNSSGGGD
jgi:uncharacterized membrane protein